MNVQCSICKDSIDVLNTKGEGGTEASALPCGHVFHEACITKWFDLKIKDTKGHHQQKQPCPQCRCLASKKDTLRLYLDLVPLENYEEDPVVIKSVNNCLKQDIEVLNEKLDSKNQHVDKLSKVNKGLRERVIELEQKVQSAETNERMLSITRVKLNKKTKELEDSADELQKVRNQLSSLRASNTILNGSLKDAEVELSALNSLEKHDIALLVFTYKKDGQKLLKKYEGLLSELSRIQEESRKLRKDLAKAQEENSVLSRVIEVYKPKKPLNTSSREAGPSHSTETSHVNQKNCLVDLTFDTPSPQPAAVFVSPKETGDTPDIVTPSKDTLIRGKCFKIPLKSKAALPFSRGASSPFAGKESSLTIPEYYDGLGGHSRLEVFSSQLKPCKIVNSRKVLGNPKRPRLQ